MLNHIQAMIAGEFGAAGLDLSTTTITVEYSRSHRALVVVHGPKVKEWLPQYVYCNGRPDWVSAWCIGLDGLYLFLPAA
jgi:hypothetical protein